MSLTFPTLELGELGDRFEDAIRESDEIEADADAAPEAQPADAEPAREGASGEPGPSAADAGGVEAGEDDFEVRYSERFAREYAEKSKADISALRSSLDRQIARWRKSAGDAGHELEEAQAYADFLEAKLGEYDPDEVARFRRNRESIRARRATDRELKERQFGDRRAFRDREFRRLYPDLDPDDPELVAAFEDGDGRLEIALIRERLARLELSKARTPAAPTKAQPKAEPPAAAKPATPARDEAGRFVAATRERERARGREVPALSRSGAAPRQEIRTLEQAREHVHERLRRMGLS